MSKTGRTNPRRGRRGTRKAERRIVVRAIRRDPPDLRKLSRAVIAMAMREAEADAEAKAGLNHVNPADHEANPDESADADKGGNHDRSSQ